MTKRQRMILAATAVFGCLAALCSYGASVTEVASRGLVNWADPSAISKALALGCLAGISYGLGTSVLTDQAQRFISRLRGCTDPKAAASVQHERALVSLRPVADTLDACVTALQQEKGMRVLEEDRAGGRIRARQSYTLNSSGNTVYIEVTGIEEGKTSVRLSSRPTSALTIVDGGGNYLLVERVAARVMHRCGGGAETLLRPHSPDVEPRTLLRAASADQGGKDDLARASAPSAPSPTPARL